MAAGAGEQGESWTNQEAEEEKSPYCPWRAIPQPKCTSSNAERPLCEQTKSYQDQGKLIPVHTHSEKKIAAVYLAGRAANRPTSAAVTTHHAQAGSMAMHPGPRLVLTQMVMWCLDKARTMPPRPPQHLAGVAAQHLTWPQLGLHRGGSSSSTPGKPGAKESKK